MFEQARKSFKNALIRYLSVEGAYTPAWGQTELGNWRLLNPLDGTGFQRNLSTQAMQSCSAAFACVNVCAQALATMLMEHFRKLDNGGREPITTSALYRVLRSPNSYQTSSDFMMNLVYNLLYFGNAYALALRNDRQEVSELHIIPARNVQSYVDPETKAIFYGLGDNPLVDSQYTMLVPSRDVLHIRLYTPKHPLVGVSPLQYAGLAVGINLAIGGNQAAFFNNMSRPSGVLSTEQTLTGDQMSALREAFEAKSKNMAAGGVPILGWGIKWQPMTITSEDAQLIEAYRMSIEDIARVYRVPLALIGDYTKATYANTEQLISAWLATGLGFLMTHIEHSFSKFFKLPADETVDFDVSVLLRTDFINRIGGLTKAISGGLLSPNEARARENLPAVAFGDEPRLQAQVVPLSQVNATPAPTAPAAPAAPVEPEDEPPDEEEEDDTPSTPAVEPEDEEEKQHFAEWTVRQAILRAMTA